jgi:hypothetical protein
MRSRRVLSRLLRWRGVAAVLGGSMALALTPPFASAYYLAYDVPPPWVHALRPLLGALLDGAPITTVYAVYGRWFAVVYLLALPGFQGLRQLQQPPPRSLTEISWKALALALILSCIGVSGDYWFNGAGWTLTLLGLLALLLTTTVYGIALLRARIMPAWVGWSLVITGLGGFASSLLTGHIPSGPTIAPAVGWICIGVLLLRADSSSRDAGS